MLFYGQDSERILNPGRSWLSTAMQESGFQYPLVKFAVMTETDIFRQRSRKAQKKKKYNGQRIQDFSGCPSEILLFMKSMDLVFKVESKRLRLTGS